MHHHALHQIDTKLFVDGANERLTLHHQLATDDARCDVYIECATHKSHLTGCGSNNLTRNLTPHVGQRAFGYLACHIGRLEQRVEQLTYGLCTLATHTTLLYNLSVGNIKQLITAVRLAQDVAHTLAIAVGDDDLTELIALDQLHKACHTTLVELVEEIVE